MTGQTVFGISTTYAPDSDGNVQSATNAKGNRTQYDYDWGVPEFDQASRDWGRRPRGGINVEGTVAWRPGAAIPRTSSTTTSVDLCGFSRPVGNGTSTSYDNVGGSWALSARGSAG